MKIILIAMLCLGVTHHALSTNDSLPIYNFYFGVGGGHRIQGGIGVFNITLVERGGWGIQLKTQSTNILSKLLPSDYSCDPFISGTACDKEDHLLVNSLKFVHQFLTRSKKLRYGLEVGPSMVIKKMAQFNPSSSSFTINGNLETFNYYNTSITKKSTIGIDLSAKIELPIWTFFGVELGVTSNINKFKSFVGYEFIFNFGLVRNRSKK